MGNLNGLPSLVLPTTTYPDYFSCSKTNTFRRNYVAELAPYKINPTASATATLDNVARMI